MDASLVAFSAFSTIAIIGSLLVVAKKNPVASAFSLVAVFFAFAGLYALMTAHLIAALQILVYTGAIMVLFVFVIMLLNQDTEERASRSTGLGFRIFSAVTVAVLVDLLARVVLTSVTRIKPTGTMTAARIEEMGGNVQVIAEKIFTDHLFHFELTSFLLLGAIVATLALAKRKSSKSGGSA